MLNYLKKFALDILPSVAATIIGAYIVNHYINARPADAPATAALSSADPKKAAFAKAIPDSQVKPVEIPAAAANIPQPGVKAKGISERAMIEKTVAEAPAAATEKPQAEKADKPAETASIPLVEPRRRPAAPRDKVAVRTPPAVAPVVAATAPATETSPATADERRDANDLARAAIERLRSSPEASSRAPEVARATEAPRTAETPRAALAPLPPPVTVSAPPADKPSYSSAGRSEDSLRPTPPAEIPPPPLPAPLDLRADATELAPKARTNVAEEMLSVAKSMFHAVLPRSAKPAD